MDEEAIKANQEEAERAQADAIRTAARVKAMAEDPAVLQEVLRQDNLMYGGLIAIGLVLVQPFVAGTGLDLTARISVVAFSLAIPLLAALVLVNQQELFRRRKTPSILVGATRSVAMLAAFTGVVAAFWHVHWLAGVGLLVGAFLGVAVHSAGWSRLELTPGGGSGSQDRPTS